MDKMINPFAPGAGVLPPELAGREKIIDDATVNIQRAKLGFNCRSQMLLGLRGVGKTVLLNKLEDICLENQHFVTIIEAYEGIEFIKELNVKIQQLLRKLSAVENMKDKVQRGFSVLKSFLSNFNFEYEGFTVGIDPEIGSADSGVLEADLTELFVAIGELAKDAKRPWTLLIDEVQYLSKNELAALIVALHKCNQKNLPILFFGAGLPQLAAMSGDAKSYAERLFSYPKIGALSRDEAKQAVAIPIYNASEYISEEALDSIFKYTQGYPYFLQEWGYETWNYAQHGKEITATDVEAASELAFKKLDEGFFSVRLDRLTPAEQEYVIAMASLGNGVYKTSEVAKALNKNNQSIAPIRSNVIEKGMIYSPNHGEIAFTVPLFDDFLRRRFHSHKLMKNS